MLSLRVFFRFSFVFVLKIPRPQCSRATHISGTSHSFLKQIRHDTSWKGEVTAEELKRCKLRYDSGVVCSSHA